MPKIIEAIYENGVFRPLQKLKLPEHIRFKLTFMPVEKDKKEIEKTVKKQKKALLSIAGIGSSGISDVSKKHDKYLYGKPCAVK